MNTKLFITSLILLFKWHNGSIIKSIKSLLNLVIYVWNLIEEMELKEKRQRRRRSPTSFAYQSWQFHSDSFNHAV